MEFFVGKRFNEEQVLAMHNKLRAINCNPYSKLNKQDKKTLERMLRDLIEYKQLENKCGCPIDLRCIIGQGMGVYIGQKCSDKLQLAEVRTVYEWGFDVRWFEGKEEKTMYFEFNEYKKLWWTNSNRME